MPPTQYKVPILNGSNLVYPELLGTGSSITTKYLRGDNSWQTLSLVVPITEVIDGGGAVIQAGSKKYISIPYAGTLSGWRVIADVAGAIVVDVKRSTYSAFPTTSTIAGTDKPTIAATNQKAENAGPLSNWGSTAIAAGDILEFNVDTCTTITWCAVILNLTRSI